jgi:hypothetical protein
MAKKQFHVREQAFIDAFSEHIKGLSSDELAKLAAEVFAIEPTLNLVGEDTIFTFSSLDYDSDWNFHDAESAFKKVSLAHMPAEKNAAAVGEKSRQESRIRTLFEAAEKGTLPADFNEWTLRDPFGRTVAHQAALYGHLPADFKHWLLIDDDGNTVAHTAAKIGPLPSEFRDWDVFTDDFVTVAHVAAAHGNLPDGFDHWDLRAHWDVVTKTGKTVAQYAAEAGHLPESFNRWDLVSEEYRPEGWVEKSAMPKVGM